MKWKPKTDIVSGLKKTLNWYLNNPEYYLSLKKAPERVQMLKVIYEEEFERAMGEDRDRSSFTVTPQYAYFRSN